MDSLHSAAEANPPAAGSTDHECAEPGVGIVALGLLTDDRGQILCARKGSTLTIPRGVASKGESPRSACSRIVADAIGLTPSVGDVLVTEWTRPAGTRLVFDCGVISANALSRTTADSLVLLPLEEAEAECGPATGHLVVAAVRARGSGPTYLEDGRVPAGVAAMGELGLAPGVHSGGAWVWARTLPAGVVPAQSWGWLFVPDGRVLVLVDDDGQLTLPGGTVEAGETIDQTLIREVWEEARASIGPPEVLGFLRDSGPQPREGNQDADRFRARMAALLTGLGPAGVDPATGKECRRVLVPIGLVNELMGWGANGREQVAAAQRAAQSWGLDPAKAPQDPSEVPERGLAF